MGRKQKELKEEREEGRGAGVVSEHEVSQPKDVPLIALHLRQFCTDTSASPSFRDSGPHSCYSRLYLEAFIGSTVSLGFQRIRTT